MPFVEASQEPRLAQVLGFLLSGNPLHLIFFDMDMDMKMSREPTIPSSSTSASSEDDSGTDTAIDTSGHESWRLDNEQSAQLVRSLRFVEPEPGPRGMKKKKIRAAAAAM